MKKILLTLCLCLSCSNNSIRYIAKQKGIDKKFDPYIENYKHIIQADEKIEKRFEKLSINFADLKGNTIGVCYWLLDGETEIEIDKKYWKSSSSGKIGREFLVYHELEHCIRYRMHSHKTDRIEKDFADYFVDFLFWLNIIEKEGFFPDGCPNSIMYPYDVGSYCRENHYYDYLKELRNWKS
jgi:hypothetical protein